MRECERGEGLSRAASVFIAAKTDRREKVQRSRALCPKGGGNGHLQGVGDPWCCLTLWWACSASPLAWSGQRSFQTCSRWVFVQIANGLLIFYFSTNFY